MFTFWLQPVIPQYYRHRGPGGAAIIILPCGPTLSLPHLTSNMVMINHSTSNRSALLPLHSLPPLPWDPDDCLMSGYETMGSRCVIDGGQTMFISTEALWFRVTDIPSHPLAWRALWLRGWLMRLYWQREEPVSLRKTCYNMLLTGNTHFELLIPEFIYAHTSTDSGSSLNSMCSPLACEGIDGGGGGHGECRVVSQFW